MFYIFPPWSLGYKKVLLEQSLTGPPEGTHIGSGATRGDSPWYIDIGSGATRGDSPWYIDTGSGGQPYGPSVYDGSHQPRADQLQVGEVRTGFCEGLQPCLTLREGHVDGGRVSFIIVTFWQGRVLQR